MFEMPDFKVPEEWERIKQFVSAQEMVKAATCYPYNIVLEEYIIDILVMELLHEVDYESACSKISLDKSTLTAWVVRDKPLKDLLIFARTYGLCNSVLGGSAYNPRYQRTEEQVALMAQAAREWDDFYWKYSTPISDPESRTATWEPYVPSHSDKTQSGYKETGDVEVIYHRGGFHKKALQSVIIHSPELPVNDNNSNKTDEESKDARKTADE